MKRTLSPSTVTQQMPASVVSLHANQNNLQAIQSQNIIVQTKLSVGAVNDPLEHEADETADKVMRMPETSPSLAGNKPFFSPPTVNVNKANTIKQEPLKKENKEEETNSGETVGDTSTENYINSLNEKENH